MKYLEYQAPLPRAYIKDQIRYSTDFDTVFGVHFQSETEKCLIGKTPITFEGSDFNIGGFKYLDTVGLYELMFKRSPAGYKNQDLDNSVDISIRNNVHYLGYDPERGINTSNSIKFKKIIKPQINAVSFLSKTSTTLLNHFLIIYETIHSLPRSLLYL